MVVVIRITPARHGKGTKPERNSASALVADKRGTRTSPLAEPDSEPTSLRLPFIAAKEVKFTAR